MKNLKLHTFSLMTFVPALALSVASVSGYSAPATTVDQVEVDCTVTFDHISLASGTPKYFESLISQGKFHYDDTKVDKDEKLVGKWGGPAIILDASKAKFLADLKESDPDPVLLKDLEQNLDLHGRAAPVEGKEGFDTAWFDMAVSYKQTVFKGMNTAVKPFAPILEPVEFKSPASTAFGAGLLAHLERDYAFNPAKSFLTDFALDKTKPNRGWSLVYSCGVNNTL